MKVGGTRVGRCAFLAITIAAFPIASVRGASLGATASAAAASAAAFASTRSRRAATSSSAPTAASSGQTGSAFLGRSFRLLPAAARGKGPKRCGGRSGSTELKAFIGTDGGILGVGAPEVAVILLVGYFILGPNDLYKLVKEVGKFIQNIRTLGSEATKQFEDSMEESLDLQELRKAQRELNDSFSFRRSINTDGDSDFNTVDMDAAKEVSEAEAAAAATGTAAAAAATEGGGAPAKKRRKRRRVKKVPPPPEVDPAVAAPVAAASEGRVPDLDMTAAFDAAPPSPPITTQPAGGGDEKETDWFFQDPDTLEPKTAPKTSFDVDSFDADKTDFPDLWGGPPPPQAVVDDDGAYVAAEKSRFAAQLSEEWNGGVMANEDALSPLSKIMERLAILEEERMASELRITEEFERRKELEDDFYRQKKELLKSAAAEVQMGAGGDVASEV